MGSIDSKSQRAGLVLRDVENEGSVHVHYRDNGEMWRGK